MTNHAPAELQRPASGRLIFATVFAGLILNLLPWTGLGLLARPDFVLLVLLYWTINQPLRVGMAAAWGMGLIMDVADGALLGQYALAYTVAAYVALILHRRIQSFGLWQQALHIGLLLAASQLLTMLVHLASGADFIGWRYFLASITGTLLWPALALLIRLVATQKSLPEIAYTAARSTDK